METETICKGKRRKTCKKVGNGEKKDKENFHLFFCASKTPKGNFRWGWFSTCSGCGTINPLEIIRRKPTKREEST